MISFFSRGLAPSELRVVCGDWDIKQKIETRADQERKVREITGKLHNYQNKFLFFDSSKFQAR